MKTTRARYAWGMPRRPSTIRRWTLKLALSLLAGAVVTWGVAWGCALWGDIERPRVFRVNDSMAWPVPPPGSWPLPQGTSFTDSRFITVRFARSWEGPKGYWMTSREFGWPARSMRETTYVEMGANRAAGRPIVPEPSVPPALMEWSDAADLRWKGLPMDARMPAKIALRGFAINTLLTAGVLLGVVEGFAFARRRARRGKGRCPSCGYDRGGLAGDAAACPECGGKA
jgi:hypothetical protein